MGDKGIIVVSVHGDDDNDNDLHQMLRENPNAHTLEVRLHTSRASGAIPGLASFAEQNNLKFRIVDVTR